MTVSYIPASFLKIFSKSLKTEKIVRPKITMYASNTAMQLEAFHTNLKHGQIYMFYDLI